MDIINHISAQHNLLSDSPAKAPKAQSQNVTRAQLGLVDKTFSAKFPTTKQVGKGCRPAHDNHASWDFIPKNSISQLSRGCRNVR